MATYAYNARNQIASAVVETGLFTATRTYDTAGRLTGLSTDQAEADGYDTAQEVLAMLLAASLVAMQREGVAARAGAEILRISFAKVLHKTAGPCELLVVGGELIGFEALTQWIERILEDLQTSAQIQKRKARSCPRTLRQPTKDWPKTKTASSKPLRKTIVFTNP